MNSLCTMSGFTRVKSPATLPTQVPITNSNFSVNPPLTNDQVGIEETGTNSFSNRVTGWTKTGIIDQSTTLSTGRATDVRLLNFLRNNNGSPRFWNATPSSGGGNIVTCFFVGQNQYDTLLPRRFSISQTITIPTEGEYTARFWAAPRTGDSLSSNTLTNNLYNSSQSVTMRVGANVIGPKTFAVTNAFTPINFYPGFELVTGTFMAATANESRILQFDWTISERWNSAIMITGIEIYKSG
jgi:hypothetical protein